MQIAKEGVSMDEHAGSQADGWLACSLCNNAFSVTQTI
jgi:hypothetical protein